MVPTDSGTPSELSLARWWHSAGHAEPYALADGQTVRIVHQGRWSHGLGPDFEDAMVLFNDRELLTGAIELHVRTSGWRQHGHHLDSAYNRVVLHVALVDDQPDTRRQDGGIVPVLVVTPPRAALTATTREESDWSRVGGAVCAEELVRHNPAPVVQALRQLGDVRLATRVARCEASLTQTPPAQVLYEAVLEALGFSRNREQMRLLARLVPIGTLEDLLSAAAPDDRLHACRGVLLGAAGFLPLAPAEAVIARLDPDATAQVHSWWRSLGGAWHASRLPSTLWDRRRVRPANDPLLRLTAAASIVTRSSPAFAALPATLLLDGHDPVQTLVDMATWSDRPGLGRPRAIAVLVNAVLPYVLASAQHTGDIDLAAAATPVWDQLPVSETSAASRRAAAQVAGSATLRGLGERGHQGLLHLDATLCGPRRCFECPIAALVLQTGEIPATDR